MIDLGMAGCEISVRQAPQGFAWYASFYLYATGTWYSNSGEEPTDEQAFAAAKAWQARMVREAVTE